MSKSKESISIVLATYNGEKFIQKQLHSLACQKLLPRELIVSDDNSTDGTLDIIRQFALNAPFPVTLSVNPFRLGYVGNFMKAIDSCTSDLIAFCDQDDEWYPEKLSSVIDHFQNSEVLMVFHGANLIDEHGFVIGRLPGVDRGFVTHAPHLPLPWSVIQGFRCVARRSIFKWNHLRSKVVSAVDGSDGVSHDIWLTFLASVLGPTIELGQALVGYRQHLNNTVGVGDVSSLSARSKIIFKTNAEAYFRLSEAAKSRAEVLDDIAVNSQDLILSSNAKMGSKNYAKLAQFYNLRYQIRSQSRYISRIKSLLELARLGGYSKLLPGLGPKAMLKDVLQAIRPK